MKIPNSLNKRWIKIGLPILASMSVLGFVYYASTPNDQAKISSEVIEQSYDDVENEDKSNPVENFFNKPKEQKKNTNSLDKIVNNSNTLPNVLEKITDNNYQTLSKELIEKDLLAFNKATTEEKPVLLASNETNQSKPPTIVVEDEETEKPPIIVEPPVTPPVIVDPIDPEPPIIIAVDYSYLERMVNEAEQVNKSDFVSSSLEQFSYELLVSERILSDRNATQTQVDNQVYRLKESMNNLIKKGNKEVLENLIKEAESVNQDIVTSESFEKLTNSISEAKKVIQNENVTQTEVDKAVKELKEAINQLEKVESVLYEKRLLERLVNQYELLLEDDYTSESWLVFIESLNYSKGLISDENATEIMLKEAREQLENSHKQLVVKPFVEDEIEEVTPPVEEVEETIISNDSRVTITSTVDIELVESETIFD